MSPTNKVIEEQVYADREKPTGNDNERKWTYQGTFYGALHRFDDLGLEPPYWTIDQIFGSALSTTRLKDEIFKNSWVIETNTSVPTLPPGKWHAYVPAGPIPAHLWIQVPVDEGQARIRDEVQSGVEGVLLAAGSTRFSGANRVNEPQAQYPTQDAVLLTDTDFIEEFFVQQWQASMGPVFVKGCIISLMVLLIGLGAEWLWRDRIRRSVPEYLLPYQSFISRRSVTETLATQAVGVILVACGFLIYAVAIRAGLGEEGRVPVLIGGLTGFSLLRVGMRAIAFGAGVRLGHNPKLPIVYLRSFAADDEGLAGVIKLLLLPKYSEPVERSLAKAVADVGPVIAAGRPGEQVPPLGAMRLFIDNENWKDVIANLIRIAPLIVVRLGATPSFEWELKHLREECDPEKVLVFVPWRNRKEVYEQMRDQFQRLFGICLPNSPGRAWFVGFGEGWQPFLLGETGPSLISKWRKAVFGSPAPAIRDALGGMVAYRFGRPPTLSWTLMEIAIILSGILGLAYGCAQGSHAAALGCTSLGF